MWNCPVCGRENGDNIVCDCGWNRSKDYSRYATVCPIGKAEKEMVSEALYGTEYLMKRAEELQKKEQWSEAIPFYEKAAEKGNLEAMKCLGRCFWGGLGTEKDLYKALDWYCKIMIGKKQDVSLLMDKLYEEIKSDRVKQEDRSPGSTRKESTVSSPKVKHVLNNNYFSEIGKEASKSQVQNIFFENKLPQDPSVKTYSISSDGSVRYWLKRAENSYSCDLYIGAEGGVDAPESCRDLFAGYLHVQKIVFQNNFRTQNVRDMSRMFYDCWNLQTLDISNFNTENVTDMSQMFGACKRLAKLNLGNFNTRNVKKMSGIFEKCDQLETIFYSGTGAIEQIKKEYEMFGVRRSNFANHVLKKVNPVSSHSSSYGYNFISQMSTGKRETVFKKNVLNKNYFSVLGSKIRKDQIHSIIFENKLPKNSSVQTFAASTDGSVRLWMGRGNTWLNAHSQFNTGGIDLHIGAEGGVDAPEDCNGLFCGFTNLVRIAFQNNFRTRNVKNMSRMFYDCWKLRELDVSGFDSGQVTDMSRMFGACAQLEKINLRGLNTSNVKDISWMFYGCKQLKTLDLSGFDTKNVKDMSWMFWRCESLLELDLSRFDTRNVTTMCCMFNDCKSLKRLNLNNFDTRNVMDMNQMFADCGQLDSYFGRKLDTRRADRKYEMFRGCRPSIKTSILGY